MTKRENKRTRRALLIAVLALVVCVATIGGTVAWLTDTTGEVKNTFSPSNIDIDLVETVPEQKTAKMVPGGTIQKDPTVTVAENSEALWLFVKIEESTNFDTFFDAYTVASPWQALGESYEGVYYIQQPATGETAASHSVIAGDSVTVSTGVTKGQMEALTTETQPTLSFKAYAIQQANITAAEGKTVQETAWELVYTTP